MKNTEADTKMRDSIGHHAESKGGKHKDDEHNEH